MSKKVLIIKKNLNILTPGISVNVLAAWRQAGVSQRLGREKKMLLRTQCHTSHAPLAPNCLLWADAVETPL